MRLSIEDQNKFINKVARDFVQRTNRELRREYNRLKQHIPSDTLDNLRIEMVPAHGSSTLKIFLRMQDSGRHVDMRKITHDKVPIQPGNNFMLEWVRKRGRSSFRYVPGKNKKKPMNEDKELERIANAIMFSKVGKTIKGKRKRKARGWYNKTLYRNIDRFTRELSVKQAEFFTEATKTEIQKVFKG